MMDILVQSGIRCSLCVLREKFIAPKNGVFCENVSGGRRCRSRPSVFKSPWSRFTASNQYRMIPNYQVLRTPCHKSVTCRQRNWDTNILIWHQLVRLSASATRQLWGFSDHTSITQKIWICRTQRGKCPRVKNQCPCPWRWLWLLENGVIIK